MILTRAKLISHRRLVSDWFHVFEPSRWFNDMTERIANVKSGPALTLNVGSNNVTSFDRNGEMLLDAGDSIDRYQGWHCVISDTEHPIGSTPCVGIFDQCRYASGIMIVTGKGDVGKTPFVHTMASHLSGDYRVIRFGEPLSGYSTDIGDFYRQLGRALVRDKVIVIDSLKDVIGSIQGTTTSGGISRGALRFISDLGMLAASRGSIIIVALNPISSDEKIQDLMLEAARSNATSIAFPQDVSTPVWKVITRTGEGLRRVQHEIDVRYNDLILEFVPRESRKSKSSISGDTYTPQVTIEGEELNRTINRILGGAI